MVKVKRASFMWRKMCFERARKTKAYAGGYAHAHVTRGQRVQGERAARHACSAASVLVLGTKCRGPPWCARDACTTRQGLPPCRAGQSARRRQRSRVPTRRAAAHGRDGHAQARQVGSGACRSGAPRAPPRSLEDTGSRRTRSCQRLTRGAPSRRAHTTRWRVLLHLRSPISNLDWWGIS